MNKDKKRTKRVKNESNVSAWYNCQKLSQLNTQIGVYFIQNISICAKSLILIRILCIVACGIYYFMQRLHDIGQSRLCIRRYISMDVIVYCKIIIGDRDYSYQTKQKIECIRIRKKDRKKRRERRDRGPMQQTPYIYIYVSFGVK